MKDHLTIKTSCQHYFLLNFTCKHQPPFNNDQFWTFPWAVFIDRFDCILNAANSQDKRALKVQVPVTFWHFNPKINWGHLPSKGLWTFLWSLKVVLEVVLRLFSISINKFSKFAYDLYPPKKHTDQQIKTKFYYRGWVGSDVIFRKQNQTEGGSRQISGNFHPLQSSAHQPCTSV